MQRTRYYFYCYLRVALSAKVSTTIRCPVTYGQRLKLFTMLAEVRIWPDVSIVAAKDLLQQKYSFEHIYFVAVCV